MNQSRKIIESMLCWMPCISQHCKLKEIHNYHACKQINNMKTIIEQHRHRTTNIRINHCHLLPAPTSSCTNINKSARKPPARERCVGLGSVSAREGLTDCPERADMALLGPPPWGDWDPCAPENLATKCLVMYDCYTQYKDYKAPRLKKCSAKSSMQYFDVLIVNLHHL